MGSFGESLKRERELRDISLREIADATKISVRYLEALEQNRFDILPGGVFNKGFIRAYARFIGADGDALVDTYLQELASLEPVTAGPAEAGRQGPEGLHRPAEPPKRRASEGEPGAQPVTFGEGRPPAPMPVRTPPRAPDLTLEKLAAALEERRAKERAAAGRDRPRLLAVAGSFMGGAALVFALLLAARAVTTGPAPEAGPRDTTAGLAPPEEAARESDPPVQQETSEIPEPGDAASGTAIDPAAASAVAVSPTPSAATSSPERESRRETSVAGTGEPVPISPPATASAAAPPPVPTPSRSAALSPMDLRLEVMSPVLVQVSCDGEDRLNRPLLPGEMATMRCFSLIRVSATDAGALRLVVNGRRCAELGEPGSRVQGFAIRNDDVDSICPTWGSPSDARR